MVLYGRGQLSLQDDTVREFLETAHPAIRRHAIGFVGLSLGRGEEVPADVIERFVGLWQSYWAGRGKTDAQGDPAAILFGSWFATGEFPDT
jgi:hypothetical protein